MKRKLSVALLIAVLVLCCVLAVACKHQHEFTKYDYDDNNHWKVCECGEKDDSSVEKHDFTNGNCVCGKEHVHSYTQWVNTDKDNHWKVCPADNVKDNATVAPHDYGSSGVCVCGRVDDTEYTVEGVVVLRKLGAIANSNDGVTLTLSDDNGALPTTVTKSADGAFSFKAVAGKYYVNASKDGFISKRATVNIDRTTGDLTGDDGIRILLEYDAFYAGTHQGSDWSGEYGNPSKIDKSHVNDEEPYLIINQGTNDLYQFSNELYDDVAFAVNYSSSMTIDGSPAIGLVFEDNKAVMLRLEALKNNGTATGEYKAQWVGTSLWENPSITGKWDFGSDEAHHNPLSSALKTKYESDEGLEIKLVRRGLLVSAYIDGVLADSQTLPVEYETQKCRPTFIVAGIAADKEIHYSISKDVTKTPIEITNPTVDNGTVSVTGTHIGDNVVLNITADENCTLASLTVNGQDKLAGIRDGKLVLGAYTDSALTIAAEFRQVTYRDLDVSITARRLGANVNLNGKTVVLTDIMGKATEITVADGKLTKTHMADGVYTVSFSGYLDATLTIPADGEIADVTLSADSFEEMAFSKNWNNESNIADINENSFTTVKGETVAIKSTDLFNNVSLTLNAHKGRGGKQGVWFLFPTANGYDAVVIIIKDSGAIEFDKELGNPWNVGLNNITVSAKHENGWWLADDQGNGMYQSLSSEENALYEAGTFELTVVRYGNYFYVYINGQYSGNWCTVDASYAEKGAYIGFIGTDTVANKEWTFEINEDVELDPIALKLPQELENGQITADKQSYKLGDQITLTVTADDNYRIASFKINGVDMKSKLSSDGKIKFTPLTAEDVTVEVVFEEIVEVDLDVSIYGNKYDVSGRVSFNGKEATLTNKTNPDVKFTVIIANGKFTQTAVPAGDYILSVADYNSLDVTVTRTGVEAEAWVLEYKDAFSRIKGWGSLDLSKQNEGELTVSNEFETLLTDATYGDVMFTLYLSCTDAHGKKLTEANQGIAFLLGKEYVLLRMEGTLKIQFAEPVDWQTPDGAAFYPKADGAGWGDLLFFQNGDEYLQASAAGTLKLTCVRRGATFYAFLNDKYIGCQKVNDKYENVQARVGIYWEKTANGTNKTFKYEMTAENVELPEYNITQTPAANGTVAGISEQAVVAGSKVTLTLTPDDGYIFKSLTVGGKDVTSSVVIDKTTLVGTYEFTVTGDVSVAAVFEQKTFGSINATISATKYGETGPINLDGVTIKLSNVMADYKITVTNGKITKSDILAGEYTLTADGYLSQKLTVTADGTYSEAIVLVYNIFTSESGADLSKVSEGKVTATGKDHLSLTTKESYQNVTAEAHFDVPDYNSRRYGIALMFDDGKNFRVDFAVQDQGNNILQETSFNSGNDLLGWNAIKTYTEDEIRNTYIKNGLDFKLERTGKTVKLYIGTELVKTYTLDDAYETKDAQLKFIFDSNGTDGTKGFTFDITVPEA